MTPTRKAVLHSKPSFPANITNGDVETIRRMVIEGRPASEIAAAFHTSTRNIEFWLRDRKRRWTNVLSEGKFEFRPEKTVIYRRRSRNDGGYDIRPFSVAPVTMHRAMLEARV